MKNSIGIGLVMAVMAGLADLPAQADGGNGRTALVEVGAGIQATASGPRFLVAVGTHGFTFSEEMGRSGYVAHGVRFFWAQARIGVSDERAADGVAYADIEMVPVSYEHVFGTGTSRMRIEFLPTHYQREVALGMDHRVSAHLVGFQLRADLEDTPFMYEDIGCILRDYSDPMSFSGYVDFMVRGLGAIFNRFNNDPSGGVGIFESELALGGRWEAVEGRGRGWMVRAELARGRVALDLMDALNSGSLTPVATFELMTRLAVGYQFGRSAGGWGADGQGGRGATEIEFFVRGGIRGVSGIPGIAGMSSGSAPGSYTPVIEAGVMGRF